MRRSFITTLQGLMLLCVSFIFTLPLLSEEIIKDEITEGKEYWLGLPHCNREAGEAIRGNYPIAIWISSKVDTRATIEDAETGSIKNYVIRKNQVTEVPYGDALMMVEPEIAKNFGIHITADDPISVAVYMSYRWSGEAYRVTPVDWLGKKYVTLNLYQDKTDKYLPCQILIVSTDDENTVKYRPTAATNKFNAGQLATVTLQKGQCYLIENKIIPGLTQDNSTDLTGTYIESTKPIAVISGHTKAAFPKIQYTFLGRPGNFMRNMMTDMMWPIELLGTEYISAPFRYAARPRGIVQDDIGDLVRFVATENGTIISQLRQDGSTYKQISKILKRGEFHDIVNQDVAAMYKANYPVLVGQYGKTWMDHMPTPEAKKDGDQSQNPSSNGQGMLITLAPIDHWTSYACFKSPANIDNWVYLTFQAKYLNKFKFDGQSFVAKFGNSIKYINGTDYAWLAVDVSAGDHWILGDTINGGKDKATFAGYAYGNWDRSKDGFAYGYPIGINYNSNCEDSIYIVDNMLCGDVNAQVFSVPDSATCAGILSINFKSAESWNYDFSTSDFHSGDKTASYTLKVRNIDTSAKGVVIVMTRSGKILRKTYEYTPELISVNPKEIDFGMMKVGETICKTFTITNPGTTKLTVKNLRLKYNKVEFAITTSGILPIELEPLQTKDIEVCATAKVNQSVAVNDIVIADLSCYSKEIVPLQLSTGNPIVWISDADWGQVPVGNEVAKTVKIDNRGKLPVILSTMTWNDKLHFTRTELDGALPITLLPGEQRDFNVWYKPSTFGVVDRDTAWFTGNTDKDKLYSAWVGEGKEPGPSIVGYDWQKQRVIDKWQTDHGINNYEGTVILQNLVGNDKIDIDKVVVDDVDGVFSLDKPSIPTQLQSQTTFTVKAFFAPKAEQVYKVKVIMYYTWNFVHDSVFAFLEGIGQQPHIDITGHDFTPSILVNSSLDDHGVVKNFTVAYGMPLTISALRIEGPDKDAFVIDPAFLADNTKWGSVAINGQFDVPVKFTAKHPGLHEAQIVAESDAPENPVGALTGLGYKEGLMTNDHDHGLLFVSQQNEGQVFLTNTGSVPITIKRDIRLSVTGDINYFYIKGWQTALTGVKDQSTFDVNPGDTLWVDVQYIPNVDKNTVDQEPNNIKSLKAQIEYETSGGMAYSYLTGKAQIMKTVARVPKGKYRVDPGSKTEIEFLIDKDVEEAKSLAMGNITEFKAKVNFKAQGRNVQDVYPANQNPLDDGPFGVKDIVTAGTMTEGWDIIPEVETGARDTLIIDKSVLMIHFKSKGQPLNFNGNGGVLFKFKMYTYLSDTAIVPLPCEFSTLDNSALYTIIQELPGDILVNPVCVNTLRLIQLSGVQYSLAPALPNPAGSKAIINYSVGLESLTTIELYNNAGEKVATLVNDNLKPGEYELKIDVDGLNLPSGAYQYRMISGPFSETKSLVITK